MIDTHCHLDFSVFDADRADILRELAARQVTDVVIPGVIEKDWPGISQLCLMGESVNLHGAYGLHPCFMDAHEAPQYVESSLVEYIQTTGGVAVGEIGLDFFSCSATKVAQLALFDVQLSVAAAMDLPVLLHVRKAHDEVLYRLRRTALTKGGVVHAFSGSDQQAQQYIELGFALGVGGSVTYDRATKLRRIIQDMPLSSVVLETDAPDIPPAFIARGERNSPIHLPGIASAIANIKGVPVAEVIAKTTATAKAILAL